MKLLTNILVISATCILLSCSGESTFETTGPVKSYSAELLVSYPPSVVSTDNDTIKMRGRVVVNEKSNKSEIEKIIVNGVEAELNGLVWNAEVPLADGWQDLAAELHAGGQVLDKDKVDIYKYPRTRISESSGVAIDRKTGDYAVLDSGSRQIIYFNQQTQKQKVVFDLAEYGIRLFANFNDLIISTKYQVIFAKFNYGSDIYRIDLVSGEISKLPLMYNSDVLITDFADSLALDENRGRLYIKTIRQNAGLYIYDIKSGELNKITEDLASASEYCCIKYNEKNDSIYFFSGQGVLSGDFWVYDLSSQSAKSIELFYDEIVNGRLFYKMDAENDRVIAFGLASNDVLFVNLNTGVVSKHSPEKYFDNFDQGKDHFKLEKLTEYEIFFQWNWSYLYDKKNNYFAKFRTSDFFNQKIDLRASGIAHIHDSKTLYAKTPENIAVAYDLELGESIEIIREIDELNRTKNSNEIQINVDGDHLYLAEPAASNRIHPINIETQTVGSAFEGRASRLPLKNLELSPDGETFYYTVSGSLWTTSVLSGEVIGLWSTLVDSGISDHRITVDNIAWNFDTKRLYAVSSWRVEQQFYHGLLAYDGADWKVILEFERESAAFQTQLPSMIDVSEKNQQIFGIDNEGQEQLVKIPLADGKSHEFTYLPIRSDNSKIGEVDEIRHSDNDGITYVLANEWVYAIDSISGERVLLSKKDK